MWQGCAPVPAQMRQERAPSRCTGGSSERSPGTDLAGVKAQSRCRCGRGEPSPGQMWQRWAPKGALRVRRRCYRVLQYSRCSSVLSMDSSPGRCTGKSSTTSATASRTSRRIGASALVRADELVRAHTHIRTRARTHAHICALTHARTHAHTHKCRHTSARTQLCARMYTYAQLSHTHTRAPHTRTHTHTHTHTHSLTHSLTPGLARRRACA